MTLIIIFSLSLLISIIFFALKFFDIKYNKENILFKFLSKLDPKSEKLLESTKIFIVGIIQTIKYIFTVKIKDGYNSLIYKFKEKLIFEYQKRHDIIMGKRSISINRPTSFYLRKITENKNTSGTGKIEDMLPE